MRFLEGRYRQDQSGGAYIAVLILVSLLSVTTLSFVTKSGIRASTSMNRLDSMKADYYARAAAHHALWRLLKEPTFFGTAGQYKMHSFSDGRYGYRVQRHTSTTYATIATIGIYDDAVAKQSYVVCIDESGG